MEVGISGAKWKIVLLAARLSSPVAEEEKTAASSKLG